MSERMIAVDKYLDDTKSNMLLQVHDEIICEIHKDELATIPFEIKALLEINSLDNLIFCINKINKWYIIWESNNGEKMEIVIALGVAWWAWNQFMN